MSSCTQNKVPLPVSFEVTMRIEGSDVGDEREKGPSSENVQYGSTLSHTRNVLPILTGHGKALYPGKLCCPMGFNTTKSIQC
jgi:hypothetical protein